ncbi:MAG: isoaspartyl peptidase/L-asparaginase [Pirellulaceae bacterium]
MPALSTTCSIVIGLLTLAFARPSAAQEKTYAIAIHGGAGAAPPTEEWRKQRTDVLEQALTTGKTMLQSGKSSLDTVEAVVRILEDSPYFNAGKGAVLNAAGTHELDATIMDGRNRAAGAVGGARTVKNPISLARRVMLDTKHILLATDGAEKFADACADDPQIERVPNSYFTTEYRTQQLRRAQQAGTKSDGIGTVGCVALDTLGNLAAATSTGGLNNKQFGRLGDSPIVGAGTFADNNSCAVSCTGIGEDFMRHVVAYDVAARMEYRGDSLEQAVKDILSSQVHQVRGGLIAVSHTGDVIMQFNTPGMARAAATSQGLHAVHAE